MLKSIKSLIKSMLDFFNRRRGRFLLLSFIPVFILTVAFLRLIKIQIVDHDSYMAEATKLRVKSHTLYAKRGQIYFKSGATGIVPAVLNERTWLIFVDPSYVADKNKVQVELGKILGEQMITTWDKVWADMSVGYVPVAKHVDYETVTKVKAANLQGVGQQETSKRIYPQGTMAAQVLGFVNGEGVGSGIEGSMNERLSGKDGLLKTVTDVNSIPLSIGDDNIEVKAQNGEDIVLTIDENVQRKAETVLKNNVDGSNGVVRNASVVILNPNNGQVMAMANYPTYNPEEYYKVTDASVFTNRVTELAYEPASVCKPFTYAAAINEGKINLDSTYYNAGYTKVDDRIIRNARGTEGQVGTRNFWQALDYSLNTGSIEVLRKIGDGKISKAARTTLYNYLYNGFGLGHKTGIELYEEHGTIISPDDKSGEGNAVRYANMTFGQGMNLTMIQVAAGFASLVNGGQYYQPTIIAGSLQNGKLVPAEQKLATHTSISAETSATMRKMLQSVRKANNGANYDLKGYNIGAKTGTAETYDENGRYTSDRTMVGTIGYGSSKKEGELPQYVILVRVDGNAQLWGASNAMPIFNQLSNFMLEYLRIEPVI